MTNWMTTWSTYLFARPSWIEGAARAMDLGGTLQEYNYAPSGSDADTLAMMADWQAIGDDLRKAVENIGSEAKVEISEQLLLQANNLLQVELEHYSPFIFKSNLLLDQSKAQ